MKDSVDTWSPVSGVKWAEVQCKECFSTHEGRVKPDGTYELGLVTSCEHKNDCAELLKKKLGVNND